MVMSPSTICRSESHVTYPDSTFSSWILNWYSCIFFFLCGQKEETRKNREHAPPSNKWAFRCLAAELAASPLRQSSPETTPKSLICYRRLPLSFAQQTPRHLSWQTSEAVFIMISFFRIGLDLNIQNTRSIKNENRLTLVDTLDSRHSILFDYRVWSEAEILEFIIRFKIDGVFDGFHIDVN